MRWCTGSGGFRGGSGIIGKPEDHSNKRWLAPVVAKCDRSRVLSSWAPYCGNLVPAEVQIEFSSVRHLTPQQFVEKLSKELGAVAVMDKNQDHRSMNSSDLKDRGQVPSTRVRQALAIGDVNYVSEILVHQHRLISTVGDQKELAETSSGWRISFPKSYLSNLRELQTPFTKNKVIDYLTYNTWFSGCDQS
ncbi:hypothetical protein Peur_049931 [Populus x canadensis]